MHAEDQNMEDVMDASMPDIGTSSHQHPQPLLQTFNTQHPSANANATVASVPQSRDPFRDIPVKVHIRRPERDTWAYMGRGIVSQEISGQSSRVVVRAASSSKILTVFGEGAALQAERRGNFVVIGCVEGGRVVSWSLNALNNSETVRLLASIELACYASKQAMVDPVMHGAFRRRVARMIKDDRRRRHKRRKDQDSMVAAFARTGLGGEMEAEDTPAPLPDAGAPPPAEPIPIPAPVVMPIPEPAPGPGPGDVFVGYPQP
ncbi:hypothetical protein GSI_06557 [Ganoderma sinense ZZ0214-1]|uniref:Uncharacterized protein n=1 Tax=Ganoderma sinense ZZ0214-1 TaxID=1077348 RepID=A0A2G8SDM5_9APHY|nr:hypothetical protein GSI_06557 [Ganoderma sinense ZZ0214-1]